MDKAVNSVFAALVWHSQELRDQIVLFGKQIVSYNTIKSNPIRYNRLFSHLPAKRHRDSF